MDIKKILLAIASWFVPIVGVILYFTTKDEDLREAKLYLTVSLVSVGLTFVVSALYVGVILLIFGGFTELLSGIELGAPFVG